MLVTAPDTQETLVLPRYKWARCLCRLTALSHVQRLPALIRASSQLACSLVPAYWHRSRSQLLREIAVVLKASRAVQNAMKRERTFCARALFKLCTFHLSQGCKP